MSALLWIFIGSGLGGLSRYALSGAVAVRWGDTFPWGTLVVNLTGSLVIGFVATLAGPDGRLLIGTTTRQFIMAGFLGGFTTYSSFSLQTLNLMRQGDWLRAGANVTATMVLCFLAVWVGHLAAAWFNSIRGS